MRVPLRAALALFLVAGAAAAHGTPSVVESGLPSSIERSSIIRVKLAYQVDGVAHECSDFSMQLQAQGGVQNAQLRESTGYDDLNATPYSVAPQDLADGLAFVDIQGLTPGPVRLCVAVAMQTSGVSNYSHCWDTSVVDTHPDWVVQPLTPTSVIAGTPEILDFILEDGQGNSVIAGADFTVTADSDCTLDTDQLTTDAETGLAGTYVTCSTPGPHTFCTLDDWSQTPHCQVERFGAPATSVDAGTLDAGVPAGTPALTLSLVDLPDAGIRPGAEVRAELTLQGLPRSGASLALDLAGLSGETLCVENVSACTPLSAGAVGYALPDGDTLSLRLSGFTVAAAGQTGSVVAHLQVDGQEVAQDGVSFQVEPLRASVGCSAGGAALLPLLAVLLGGVLRRQTRSA